jgi:DNA-binding beta-propeller fold protein YncE
VSFFSFIPKPARSNPAGFFGKKGDYEGIEMVGSDIFAVKSNGTIVRIGEGGDTSIYTTHLNEENDVEGLGYDATRNCLMLACKGKSGKGDVLKGKKAIYAFDLAALRLNETPAYVIDRDEIGRLKGAGAGFWENLLGVFSSGDDARAFGPSGLAFSPLDNNLYIIASVGKVLVVLNPDGKIIRVEKLDPDRFKQPEGLCFDRSGRLYISSEGGKHKGRIFRFSPVGGR